jgi:hypothetical protein
MKNTIQNIIYLSVIIFASQFLACEQPESNYVKIEPAHLEHIENSEITKLTLTEKAAERIDIKIGSVKEETLSNSYGGGNTQKVVPYSAIIYNANGNTWVYTNPEPLVFKRAAIKIDRIEKDKVYLLDGPPVGTQVAIQGVAELYGTEYHVGH